MPPSAYLSYWPSSSGGWHQRLANSAAISSMPLVSNQAASTLVYTFPVLGLVSTAAGIRISDTQGMGSPLLGLIIVGDRRKVLRAVLISRAATSTYSGKSSLEAVGVFKVAARSLR